MAHQPCPPVSTLGVTNSILFSLANFRCLPCHPCLPSFYFMDIENIEEVYVRTG